MIRDTSATDVVLAKPGVSRPWRRWVSTGLVVLGLLAGVVYLVTRWAGASRSIDKSRLRISAVEQGTLVRDVVSDGRIVAANSPTLYAIAAGAVDFKVRAGDKVKAGQSLATIASPDLQSRLVQEQATLAALEATVGRAGLDIQHGRANQQQQIAQAEVDRQTAAREVDRQAASREVDINREMYSRGVISELELRRSEDALKKAEIVLQHAKVEAGLSGKELDFDLGTKTQGLDRQRAVVKELERQVAELDIKSPFDGQVGQLLVAQRTVVAANAGILTVVDLGQFELEILVPDSFARDLALGMNAEIRSGNATFAGRIRSVSPEVVAGNVATRLEFVDKRPEGLRQNQRLTARILIEERPNVLKVERGDFLSTGGASFGYFVDGDYAEKRPIRTGAVSLDAVEIVSGAKAGEQMVTSGADQFGTAQRVRLN